MKSGAAQTYLDFFLSPLAPYLDNADVTDIYINRPGEIILETVGGESRRIEAAELDEPALLRLAHQIAAYSRQGLNPASPLLSASLPGGARVQIVIPPAALNCIAISIRRHSLKTLPLGAFRMGRRQEADVPWEKPPPDELEAFLLRAVEARMNIVISGGTSSGKTTLLNSLAQFIPIEQRLISIEDTAELVFPHENCVRLIASRSHQAEAAVGADQLLEASLRMRPDRILLGELRGAEAFAFLRAVNSGHPGSMTTLHADSPEKALIQLALMCVQASANLSFEHAFEMASKLVDIVIQVTRRDGVRTIADIAFPALM